MSHADDAMPHVVLRYRDGSFHLASDLMRKSGPSLHELETRAAEIGANPGWGSGNVPGEFWQYVIDLTYSGDIGAVNQFAEMAWPSKRTDRQHRMQEFFDKLSKSPYWHDIQVLNYEYFFEPWNRMYGPG